MHSERKKRIGLVMLLAGFVFACSSSLYVPKESTLYKKEVLNALQKGGCHTLYLPEKYGTSQWRLQTERMAAKAKLTDQEKELILGYLTKNDSSKPN
jgi:hypothetical protein